MRLHRLSGAIYLVVEIVFLFVLSNSQFPESQYEALNALYTSTGGSYWTWNGIGNKWNFSDPNVNPCTDDWQGVVCNYSPGFGYGIQGLQLSVHNLTGTVPETILQLQNLTNLQLAYNAIEESFPAFILNLPRLIALNLEYNKLGGSLSFAAVNSTVIESLIFNNNNFSGPLPHNIQKLGSSLKELFIGANYFSSSLPDGFYQLESLTVVELDNNQFTGTISSHFRNLTELEFVIASENKFYGPLPPHIFPSRLVTLDFSNNSLSGLLPATMGNFSVLEVLDLGINQFFGTISASFVANLTSLKACNFDFNSFHGT
jgi:Leucine-rich repeat (LRR) protein